jgi:cytochrome P450
MIQTEAVSIDNQLKSPEFIANPYPLYRTLRETDPVYYSQTWGVWILTRYDDIMSILRDPKRFSNAGRYSALLDQLPEEVQDKVVPLRHHYSAGMVVSDPPNHTRLRNLVRDSFSAARIRAIAPHIQKIVDNLLDQAQEQSEFDLVAALAFPLPVIVISELLGVPTEDRTKFTVWGEHLIGLQATGGARVENALRAAKAIVQIENYFREVCAERKAHPRDDLISYMVEAQEGSDKLSEAELINTCVTFLFAGHETTKNLIGNGILTLMEHPQMCAELRQDSSLMALAIEEMLRYESPIQRGWRRVTEDTTIRGKHIRAGELVFIMFGAADRDPEQFPDPDRFDIRRINNSHLAFGSGVHFCIGAPLARVEAPVAISTVLRRFPKLRLTRPVEWLDSIHVRGPKSLHVALN